MPTPLQFPTRRDFRAWLGDHARTEQGVWLRLGKPGGPPTLTAHEALEEALCFGWIDGRVKRVDEGSYLKYFAPRRPDSPWSQKNRALADSLAQRGLLTDLGRAAIDDAKRTGRWDAPGPAPISAEQIAAVADLLHGAEPARTNFLAMPPSVQRTYTRGYLAAKTEAGRASRLTWMTDRLQQNLRPM